MIKTSQKHIYYACIFIKHPQLIMKTITFISAGYSAGYPVLIVHYCPKFTTNFNLTLTVGNCFKELKSY